MWADIQKFRGGAHRVYPKGGGGGTSASLTTVTQNTDARAVLQDSVQVGAGSSSNISTDSTSYSYTQAADAAVLDTIARSMPDSIVALTQAGATVVRDSGGAVVDLLKDSAAQQTKSWDHTLQYGADTVDRAIDVLSQGFGMASQTIKESQDIAKANIGQAYGLAGKAVDSFTPTENKNADIGKYAMFAAAAVAAAVLLKGSK